MKYYEYHRLTLNDGVIASIFRVLFPEKLFSKEVFANDTSTKMSDVIQNLSISFLFTQMLLSEKIKKNCCTRTLSIDFLMLFCFPWRPSSQNIPSPIVPFRVVSLWKREVTYEESGRPCWAMSDPVEKMLNQAALEALYSATYVDNFLG